MFNEKIRKSDENITSDIMPNQIWGIDEGLYKYPYLLWGGVSYYKIMKKILAEFEHNKVM